MKDYYKILGIVNTASNREIKKAHRKLSMQFHPDRNQGDNRFANKLIEVQEAYEVLGNQVSRKDYDYNRNFWKIRQGSDPLPLVEYFAIDKSVVFAGDELTFTWRTSHADNVILEPFGSVPSTGQKTYRIKYSLKPSLTFRLLAKNTTTGQINQAVLIVVYSGYRRLNGAISLLIMVIVFLILYIVTRFLS